MKECLAAVEHHYNGLLRRIPNCLEFTGCVVASWEVMLEASSFFIQLLPQTMKDAAKVLHRPLIDLGFGCMTRTETRAPEEVSWRRSNVDLAITLLEGLFEGMTLV